MEISDRKKQASRDNGKLGGVKTNTGKEVSKMNAVRHGILAQTKTGYDPINVQEVYARLAKEFGTAPFSRRILVEQLALTVLRLARCARAETEILKEALNPRITHDELINPAGIVMRTIIHERVIKEGEPATLSMAFLERLGLIYERYEPRLVSRMLRLLEALKA